jgi:hypothetical protein
MTDQTKNAKVCVAFTIKCDIDFSSTIEEAKLVMELNTGNIICYYIVSLELSGPARPGLSLVGLPGLCLAGNNDQLIEAARFVETLKLSCTKRQRLMALTVISADIVWPFSK